MALHKFLIEHAIWPAMEKRKGNKIREIQRALEKSQYEDVAALQRERLTELLRQVCDMTPAGIIRKLDLRKPVTIKKGMNLYVGYQILIGEDEDYDCLLFDNSPYGLKGLNWYGLDDKWFNNIAGIELPTRLSRSSNSLRSYGLSPNNSACHIKSCGQNTCTPLRRILRVIS